MNTSKSHKTKLANLLFVLGLPLVIFAIYAYCHRSTTPANYKVIDVKMQRIELAGLGEGDSLTSSTTAHYLLIIKLEDAATETRIIGIKSYFYGIGSKIKGIKVFDKDSLDVSEKLRGLRHYQNLTYGELGFTCKDTLYNNLKCFTVNSLENVADTVNELKTDVIMLPKLADSNYHYYCTFLAYKGKKLPTTVTLNLDASDDITCKVNNTPIMLKFEALTTPGSFISVKNCWATK